jgi:hypothetical protein
VCILSYAIYNAFYVIWYKGDIRVGGEERIDEFETFVIKYME